MAYQLCGAIAISYLAIAGIVGWYRLDEAWDYEHIDADQIYGRSLHYEEHIVAPMLWYQIWNTIFCLLLAEYRDPVMIAHHAVTALLVYMTLHPFLQHYGIFFFGVPEVTSIPLTLVDIFKQFPDLRDKFSTLNSAARWVFGLSFLVVRLVLWSRVCLEYWIEAIAILQSGAAHSLFVNVFFMGANVFLTGLQWLWGYKIVIAMVKQSKPTPTEDKKKKAK
jgi:hypothetical protein